MRTSAIACAACTPAASTRPIENHPAAAAAAQAASLGACPRLTNFAPAPWEHDVFPQCAPEPFATDLPVCGASGCAWPCRVTEVAPDGTATTTQVHDEGSGRAALAFDHGRLVAAPQPNGDTLRVVYERDRVVAVEVPNLTARFDYDDRGRIVKVRYDDLDEATTYRYDRDGDVVEMVDVSEHATYTYDAEHRLVHVASELHGGDIDAADATLAYDSRGRLATITHEWQFGSDYRSTTRYDYCGH